MGRSFLFCRIKSTENSNQQKKKKNLYKETDDIKPGIGEGNVYILLVIKNPIDLLKANYVYQSTDTCVQMNK